ncbi:MAG: hypothetical protein V5A40_19520 [Haloarculaceae archaeon]
MTGFSAVLCEPEAELGGLREGLHHTGRESVAEFADGDVLVWAWGDLFGHDGGEGYAHRADLSPGLTDAEYCASLYDRHGADFPAGLNGEFAGCLYDRAEGTVAAFTDRLLAALDERVDSRPSTRRRSANATANTSTGRTTTRSCTRS